MSAADFLFAPEVQKLMQVVYAAADQSFTASELARRSKLEAAEVERTLAHLVGSGILQRLKPQPEQPEHVALDRSFVFHDELRRIALKSFAAAEPIRAMLKSKFKESVLRAFVLGEDRAGTVEILVVHGQLRPDEAAMAAACQKLSKTLLRHLQVHVVPEARFTGLAARDPLAAKLEAASAFEIIALGETRAQRPAERIGLLQSAKKRLAGLSR